MLCLGNLGSAPAQAWTKDTRLQMLEDATRLVPPALQRLLERYRRYLLRGMSTRKPENEAGHFQNPDSSGRLVDAAATSIQEATVALQERASLRRIAYRMGRVAHLVGDLNFPLASSDADPRESLYSEDFARYVNRMLPKYRRTLERREPAGLDATPLRDWAQAAVDRARELYDPIVRSYWRDGVLVKSSTFDERSIPFGIGALAYSRAVSDLAQAWTTIWRVSGGDASDALYEKLFTAAEREAEAQDPQRSKP